MESSYLRHRRLTYKVLIKISSFSHVLHENIIKYIPEWRISLIIPINIPWTCVTFELYNHYGIATIASNKNKNIKLSVLFHKSYKMVI